MSAPIRVMVVDDSAPIRQMLSDFLASDKGIEVIDTAGDPFEAREKIKRLRPDVLTLDIEMPKMDGLSFLEKIMTLRPMPVVMVSTLTRRGAQSSIRALEIGAFDYIAKPERLPEMEEIRTSLIAKVKAAASARIRPATSLHRTTPLAYHGNAQEWLFAIGASTGGVEAIGEMLRQMPPNGPPIIISQHMPPVFTHSFAQRLDGLCHVRVCEAAHRLALKPGMAVIAPGSHHLRIKATTFGWACLLDDGPQVSGHRPSVDVMFESVAQEAGPHAVAALLTGMGKDGAAGLLSVREMGGVTFGQSEASCVVYGMPKAAWQIGAVQRQVAIGDMAREMLEACG